MILNIRALAVLAALSLSAAACAAPTEEADAIEAEETSQDLVSRSAYFETFEGLDGQHYFHLMAGNGQKVLRGEGYATAQGAEGGVAAVTSLGRDKRNFELLEAANGEWYFNLKSGNGEVVGSSQLYASKYNAERGARTVRALVRVVAQGGAKAAPRRERFELFTGEDRQSYFRLRAGNGEIMLSSEGYASKQGAEDGLASVKANGRATSSFEIFEAGGGWAIRLVAANGEPIARGEIYASKSNATRAVSRLAEILARRVSVVEQ